MVSPAPPRTAAGPAAGPALVPIAVLVTVVSVIAGIGGSVVAWPVGVAVFVVIEIAAWLGLVLPALRGAEERAVRALGPARPARQEGSPGEARLLNLVDGLAPTAGVPRPVVLVVDDPARNAAAVGRDARRGQIVVTTGLLDTLSRMELEAVISHLLVRLRDGATARVTLALALPGPARHGAGSPPADADLAAAGLTRYPPALASALRALGPAPAVPSGASPRGVSLWLAPPGEGAALEARAEMLDVL